MRTTWVCQGRLGKALLHVVAVAVLVVGPTLNTATQDGGLGLVAARGFGGGGGGARGGGGFGGGGARGGGGFGGAGASRPSSIDRAPRAASASQGSIGGANRDFSASSRPAGSSLQSRPASSSAQARPQIESRPQVESRPASRQETRPAVSASDRVAGTRPASDAARKPQQKVATQDRAELNKKLQTAERPKAGTGPRGTDAGRLAAAGAGGAAAGLGAGALAGGGDRAGQLGDRQGERQADRGQRQDGRAGARDDRQAERGQRQEDRQGDRGQRQEDRAGQRDERQQNVQQNREERRQNVDQRRQEFTDNRQEIRNERQQRMQDIREDRREFAEDWREDRQEMWEDVYDDHHYWGDWDDDDDDWVWGLVGGAVGFAIGAAVNDPPYGYVEVPYGGTSYQYYGGAFYQPAPAQAVTAPASEPASAQVSTGSGGVTYVTVPAPVGASVDAPPLDCTIVFGPRPDDPGYCYFGGAFFIYDEKTDKYVVAEPPVGTQVPFLPLGYTTETIGGVEYYRLGSTFYRHYIAGEDETFVVSRP